MIKEAIIDLSNKKDLSPEVVEQVMDEIMSGQTSQVQTAAYLVALSMKGETIDEIVASAKGMRKHAAQLNSNKELLEIVGTGGDRSNSFNISTTSSIILAAAGVNVAKHGNRAASSKSGAADVLEALGVNIRIDPEKNEKVLDEVQIRLMRLCRLWVFTVRIWLSLWQKYFTSWVSQKVWLYSARTDLMRFPQVQRRLSARLTTAISRHTNLTREITDLSFATSLSLWAVLPRKTHRLQRIFSAELRVQREMQ